MPQQDLELQGWTSSQIHDKIKLLIDNLINIKDEGGKFLLKLPDGRIIDTKGWNDWEWSTFPDLEIGLII
jgi:unsaturated rhamnogalacturonyl hydrolase